MSQRILFSDKEEECHKDEDEAIVSQVEEETILGQSNTELTGRSAQGIEEKILKISRQRQQRVLLTQKFSILKKCLKRIK